MLKQTQDRHVQLERKWAARGEEIDALKVAADKLKDVIASQTERIDTLQNSEKNSEAVLQQVREECDTEIAVKEREKLKATQALQKTLTAANLTNSELQKDNKRLLSDVARLTQLLSANELERSTSATATPAPAQTCETCGNSLVTVPTVHTVALALATGQRPDIQLTEFTAFELARLRRLAGDSPGLFGRLVLCYSITSATYTLWLLTTNWNGSRNKFELPTNLKEFVMRHVNAAFPGNPKENKRLVIYTVDDYLRKPRKHHRPYDRR